MERYHIENIERDGLTFAVYEHHDQHHGRPWEEEEGHGEIREVRGSTYASNYPAKLPGERPLARERGWALYYNFADAVKTAREEWGISNEKREEMTKQLGRAPTQGEIAVAAAEQDFERMRRYASGDWHYIGLEVELLDVDGEGTGLSESLWGIESDCGDYVEEVSAELADQVAQQVGRKKVYREVSGSRETKYRIRH